MIPAAKIQALPQAPTSTTDGRSGRPGMAAALEPAPATGRELATQRDALLFRSEAVLCLCGPAPALYLAQQIGQLWPSPPPAIAKSAMHAYLRHSGMAKPDGQHASVLA